MLLILFELTGTAPAKTVAPPASESGDKTLSPYFFVKSEDPALDQLPLKSTSAAVNIAGVIADVQVTQVYKNEGKKALEAIYVFPASTRAAVYGMKMTVGKRVIEAKIKKREDARKEYDAAKQQGKTASLLEQQRPNVFQMNVANILPGDEIKVELKYTELLVPTDRVYEFSYPTVVGPRYSNQKADAAPASERWIANPYLKQGEAPTYTFDIAVNLAAGMPIKELACTSHKVSATYNGPALATVKLDAAEKNSGNRDYVLRYRLDGDAIQSGLLLYRGEKENFFLLMAQPPKRVTRAQMPGREYIFIVDVSGSMWGFPLDISKKLMKNVLSGLKTTDRFNVLFFSGGNWVMAEESLLATPENVRKAVDLIDRQKGGGGTELLPAMQRALKMPKAEEFSRTLVIATDGYVQVEEETFDLIRNNLGDANMFAFGIGTSVNRHLIEGMAHVGMGEPFVITKGDEAPAAAERFRKMIESPVLTRVKVDFKGFDAYDVEPVAIPDVLAERPVVVFGKWRGEAKGRVTLSGITGEGKYTDSTDVSGVKPIASNTALQYLWARHRITLLSDYNKLRTTDKRVREVTDLGLKYNLLTAYTSFIAVDSEIRNKGGESTTVQQPLPLPQGVSDYAVGSGGVPMASMAPMGRGMAYDMALPTKMAREEVRQKSDAKKAATSNVVQVTAAGGLSKADVLSVAQGHLKEIEQCAQGITGKLVIELTVAPDGAVKEVKIVSGVVKGSTAEESLIQAVKKWIFPAAKAAAQTKATITFELS
jgi:Ca-activated chloride channel family protein